MIHVLTPRINEAIVRQEGDDVILLYNGRLVTELGWEAALALGRALIAQAKKAEEHAKATKIIADQAVLVRSGFPIMLSANPDIVSEANKAAVYDKNLRRYIPQPRFASVKFTGAVGVPTIKVRPPKELK